MESLFKKQLDPNPYTQTGNWQKTQKVKTQGVWATGYSWELGGFMKRGELREHVHNKCSDSSSPPLQLNSSATQLLNHGQLCVYSRLKTGESFSKKIEQPKRKDPKDTETDTPHRNNPARSAYSWQTPPKYSDYPFSPLVSALRVSSQPMIIWHLRKAFKTKRRKETGGVDGGGGGVLGNRHHAERRNCQKLFTDTVFMRHDKDII